MQKYWRKLVFLKDTQNNIEMIDKPCFSPWNCLLSDTSLPSDELEWRSHVSSISPRWANDIEYRLILCNSKLHRQILGKIESNVTHKEYVSFLGFIKLTALNVIRRRKYLLLMVPLLNPLEIVDDVISSFFDSSSMGKNQLVIWLFTLLLHLLPSLHSLSHSSLRAKEEAEVQWIYQVISSFRLAVYPRVGRGLVC